MTSMKEVEQAIDDLSQRLDALTAQVQRLDSTDPAAPATSVTHPTENQRAFDTVDAWVDEVFCVLAARKQYAWCPRWRAHPEAHARLTELWRAWEYAHANTETDLQAMENWLRLVFDHHSKVLLDRAGSFADCQDGHSDRHRPAALPTSDYTGTDPSDTDIATAIQSRFRAPPPQRTVNLTEQPEGDQ